MEKEIIEVKRKKPRVLETDLFFDEEIYIREPCDFKSKGYDEIVYIRHKVYIRTSVGESEKTETISFASPTHTSRCRSSCSTARRFLLLSLYTAYIPIKRITITPIAKSASIPACPFCFMVMAYSSKCQTAPPQYSTYHRWQDKLHYFGYI